MQRLVVSLLACLCGLPDANACGAYFTRAVGPSGTLDAKLYNQSTRTVFARFGDVTTVTMVADYRGSPREFAAVIAVPTVLTREQIKTVDARLVERIDAATAPRFTVRQDPDPCYVPPKTTLSRTHTAPGAPIAAAPAEVPNAGVVVEARYIVGEYDVAVLSAPESDALLNWLGSEGYQVPAAAKPVLAAYIQEGLKFFVAKVVLKESTEGAYKRLSPLQISYRSPKMWVPLRLSTVIAEAPQDMFVFAVSHGEHIEAANMPEVTLSTADELPGFVRRHFDAFYEAAVSQAHRTANSAVAVVEARRSFETLQYASRGWNLSPEELSALGIVMPSKAEQLTLTRLHVRYDKVFCTRLTTRTTARTGPAAFQLYPSRALRRRQEMPAGRTLHEAGRS
jgi:hypothetical protein